MKPKKDSNWITFFVNIFEQILNKENRGINNDLHFNYFIELLYRYKLKNHA